MFRTIAVSAVVPVALLLSSCSSTKDPFNTMCENIVANLMASSQLGFSGVEQTETADEDLMVSLNFARGERAGTAVCYYAPIVGEDEIDQGDYDTSPYKVVLNGQTISNKDLMSATFNATKGMIKETVENTSQQVNEMARDAADTARDVAGNAAEKAREVAHDAAEKVQKSLEK